jgi:hypothetical protein
MTIQTVSSIFNLATLTFSVRARADRYLGFDFDFEFAPAQCLSRWNRLTSQRFVWKRVVTM